MLFREKMLSILRSPQTDRLPIWLLAPLFVPLSVALGTEERATDGWGGWQPYASMAERSVVCQQVGEAFALKPSAVGKGIPNAEFEDFLSLYEETWRLEDDRFRPLFSDAAKPGGAAVVAEQLPSGDDPGPQHYRFFLVIEALCKVMPRADADQQQALTERLSKLVHHYVAEWWRWRQGGSEPRGRPGFPVYGFPDYVRVMAEASRLSATERTAFAEVLYDQLALNHEQEAPDVQMDHLKAMVAYLPWVPMLMEGSDREAMIGRVAAFYDRVLRCEKTFTADGAIIHHGIWHYAYASYSLTRFLDNLVSWHACGLYLSSASRAHLRRAAFVAAVLSDNVSRAVPFNVEGRSGGMPRIGGMTDHLLKAVAFLGDEESLTSVWRPAAAVLKAIHPEAAKAPEFADVHASREPLMGVWAVNRGGAMVVRQPGWMAVVGGLSPLTGKHEIYSWTQHNNYSIFVRRGGLAIITDEGNAQDPGLGYGLEAGFDWSLIPGATTEPRTADQLFSRRHNTFVFNSGMAAACGIHDIGIWALDQVVGPGPAFRKSLHVADGRLTSVTTSIRPDQPRTPRPRVSGILPSSATTPVGTTLFQWPVQLEPGEDDPASSSKPSIRRHPGGSVTVWDRYGTAYCMHPRSEGRLRTARRRQSQVLLWDRYLREGLKSPIDWSRWTVGGGPLDRATLSDLSDKYTPREGWFDVAGIIHGDRQDADALPAAVYTVLPLAGEEMVATFAKSLAESDAPLQLLAADNAHHVVRHGKEGAITIAIFDPTVPLPEELPISRVNLPCTITLNGRAQDRAMAAAWIPPSSGDPFVVELRHSATAVGDHGTATRDGLHLSLKRPDLLPWQGRLVFDDKAASAE